MLSSISQHKVGLEAEINYELSQNNDALAIKLL
jgi:hypothetical protein